MLTRGVPLYMTRVEPAAPPAIWHPYALKTRFACVRLVLRMRLILSL